jgi:hypothetical protein
MNPRFTIDGSDALEAHLARTCNQVSKGVREIVPREKLQALLLGGGYGRGHGGVLKTSSGDKPYNDLEFYICIDGSPRLNERKFGRDLHNLAHTLTFSAGVEVEFKITSIKKLQTVPPTMFTYDLAAGHRALLGKNDFFADSSSWRASDIPISEATRLLMNRCSGLLFSKERLQRKPFTIEDADFVGRNHAKAQLGFGDAFLAAHGRYHWDCRVRNHRLKDFKIENEIRWLEKLNCHHDHGLEFKLHPRRTVATMDSLCSRQRELVDLGGELWLWLENKRLGTQFDSAKAYAQSRVNKCPETNPVRNFFVNAKTFHFDFFRAKPFRYPRQRLLHSLALLLWDNSWERGESLRRSQRELNTGASGFSELVKAYEALWKRFN